MKKISLPTDLLVALAQLEDKDLAFLLRAIISYANEGIVPTFSNAALKAFFSLFRSTIDEQRSTSEKLSIINRDNAKGKKSSARKKDSKCPSSANNSSDESNGTSVSTDSLSDSAPRAVSNDSQRIVNDNVGVQSSAISSATSSVSPSSVTTVSEPISLEAIEAVYPKLGALRTESLSLWYQFSDETRKRAIDFVPSYLKQHPSASDQLYLNQYLKAKLWDK